MCNLYRNIELLCKSRNIKVADLSRFTGLNKSMFSDLKNGKKSTINIEALIKIADYFNVSLDYLVGRKKASTAEAAEAKKIMKLIKDKIAFCVLCVYCVLKFSEIFCRYISRNFAKTALYKFG